MRVARVIAFDMRMTVYFFNRGDKLPRHRHANPHTHSVLAGKSIVRLFRGETMVYDCINFAPGDNDLELPAGEWHEVEAAEDGTIILHCYPPGMVVDTAEPSPVPPEGGVLFEDGTIVYAT
jgi:quercetin dioxygenase-like cupin family protein